MKTISASIAALTLLAAFFAVTEASRADTIYVANYNGGVITEFDSVTGNYLGTFANLPSPEGLAFDSAGNLYAVSYSLSVIMKYTPAGVGSGFASGVSGNGLAIDSANNVYVGAGDTIVKYTPGGVASVFASTGLSGPEALAIDAAGNVYAANFYGNNIEKFTPGGVVSVFASNFYHPFGLAFDSAGNLYAANNSDGVGSVIWRFTPQGVLSAFATRLTVGPRGLAFDSQGNLFAAISELNPNIAGPSGIQKFTPGGVASILTEAVNTPYFIAIIPEPSTMALLGFGLPALLAFRRRA